MSGASQNELGKGFSPNQAGISRHQVFSLQQGLLGTLANDLDALGLHRGYVRRLELKLEDLCTRAVADARLLDSQVRHQRKRDLKLELSDMRAYRERIQSLLWRVF